MKAIVLAGGFGTRLRPLSCSRPKTLFPLANQPLIDYTLQNLAQGGVDTIILSVYYMAENIVRYLGPTKYDLGILYSREQRPLGKGGGIKNAEDMLNGEPFIVINGDIITDLDLRRLISFHEEKGGLATIALYQVKDPSRYGSVEIDREGRITRFVEKPEPGMAPSNLINAGIYVLEPEVLEYMPPGKRFDTEVEVFPVLAQERKLFGFEFHGYWTDIGVPEEYLNANAAILGKRDKGSGKKNENVDPTATVKEPCIFGDNVNIGADSVIGPNVSIMDNVHIGKGVRIENSIIFAGASIEDYSSVRNALIGESAVLERWVKVESGSLIGDYAQLNDGVTITEGVSICPSTTVKESILEPKRVM
ncbi:NDP-sugar synthase [Candidatus Bathyarchaeota archaeon]|nr:NDP-sugar synthase [Candidatus Bathyarchaeota archaeon]